MLIPPLTPESLERLFERVVQFWKEDETSRHPETLDAIAEEMDEDFEALAGTFADINSLPRNNEQCGWHSLISGSCTLTTELRSIRPFVSWTLLPHASMHLLAALIGISFFWGSVVVADEDVRIPASSSMILYDPGWSNMTGSTGYQVAVDGSLYFMYFGMTLDLGPFPMDFDSRQVPAFQSIMLCQLSHKDRLSCGSTGRIQ